MSTERLKLQRSWEHYRILRGTDGGGGLEGGTEGSPRRAPPSPAAGTRQDREHFAFTRAAMGALGFTGGECAAVLRVLAFVLKLGNVDFDPETNIDGTIGLRVHHHYGERDRPFPLCKSGNLLTLTTDPCPQN